MPTKKKLSLRFTLDIETWGLDARKLAFGVVQNVDTLEQYVFYTFEECKQWIQEKRKEYMEINGIGYLEGKTIHLGTSNIKHLASVSNSKAYDFNSKEKYHRKS